MEIIKSLRDDYYFAVNKRNGAIYMAHCQECNKTFRMKEVPDPDNPNDGGYFCPHCGRYVLYDSSVFIREKKWFNRSTILFRNKDSVTISCYMGDIGKQDGKFFPGYDKLNFRLKFKFKKNRQAYMFQQNLSVPEMYWNVIKFPVSLINVSQPAFDRFGYLSKYNIRIPVDVCNAFFQEIGVDTTTDIPLSPTILCWVNRTRLPVEDAKKEFEFAKRIGDCKRAAELSVKEFSSENYRDEEVNIKRDIQISRLRFAKKIYRRMTEFYRKGEKPDIAKEEILQLEFHRYGEDINSIPKSLFKAYYDNRSAIGYVSCHAKLFKNVDIWRNAIAVFPRNTKYGSLGYLWSSSVKIIYNVFKTEKRVYEKLKSHYNFFTLSETARIISRIQREGIKVKTKGNLQELHDKVMRIERMLSTPYVEFWITDNLEDWLYEDTNTGEKLLFKFARDSAELIDIGSEMDHCVGGYCGCVYSGTSIIVSAIDESGKHVVCLEIANRNENKKGVSLVQAKGYKNNREFVGGVLPEKLQKAVAEFCYEFNIPFSNCYDLSSHYRKRSEKWEKEATEKGTLIQSFQTPQPERTCYGFPKIKFDENGEIIRNNWKEEPPVTTVTVENELSFADIFDDIEREDRELEPVCGPADFNDDWLVF